MASSFYLYCILCWNPLPITSSKNELAGGLSEAPTESSNFPTPISYTLTFIQVFVASSINNELFKWFMQAYLEDNRALSASVEWENIAEKLFKAQNSGQYYKNSYMECYYFCR